MFKLHIFLKTFFSVKINAKDTRDRHSLGAVAATFLSEFHEPTPPG